MYITEHNIRFKAVRSGGPGGQNANRRATKVQAWVKIDDLPLTDEEKHRIRERLANRVNKRGELEVTDEEERFQEQNKERAIAHLNAMVEMALVVLPPRIPTEPTRGSNERRIEGKKRHGEKKRARRAG